jgi:HTH-type transcriptional regulator, competence development regulator
MKFGEILRTLRLRRGLGIKKLAPDLGVSYTYLSKLENKDSSPSEQFVKKVADYFDYDQNELMLSAGKVPDEVMRLLQENPQKAVQFLKERFGGRRA